MNKLTIPELHLISNNAERGKQFEEFLCELFKIKGYDATILSDNYGADILLTNSLTKEQKLVIAKPYHTQPVQRNVIPDLINAFKHYKIKDFIIITTSVQGEDGFLKSFPEDKKQAFEECEGISIFTIGGSELKSIVNSLNEPE